MVISTSFKYLIATGFEDCEFDNKAFMDVGTAIIKS